MIGWATESSCNRSKMAYRLANDDTSAMDDSPHSSRHASPPSVTHQPPVEAERRGIGRESSVSAIPSKYPALAAGTLVHYLPQDTSRVTLDRASLAPASA